LLHEIKRFHRHVAADLELAHMQLADYDGRIVGESTVKIDPSDQMQSRCARSFGHLSTLADPRAAWYDLSL